MHGLDLVLTLTGGLSAALILGYLTHRLGLSPIVGYLAAGLLVGPHTPGFVADTTLAEQLAEVGVILLMFGVGLQFHLEELLAVRRVAAPGAVAQSAVAMGLGAGIGLAFGWDGSAGLLFGMALAVASTVVLVRVLADNRDLHTPTGHIAVGWLVVEDLFTVVALVVLPVLFGGQPPSALAAALGITALKVAALIGFTAAVGKRLLPRVLDHVAATGSRELFTLGVLVVALGIAVGSALVFGVSMALGAFLAGLVVGRSDHSARAASDALPMRDAFAVLFFVSVGMLLEPAHLLEAPALILATLAVVILGKPLVALLIVRALRYPFRAALGVAIALAQIGEFSFILSDLGRDLGILGPEATNTLVVVAMGSIMLNPLLYRAIGPVERWVSARPGLWALLNPASPVGLPAPEPEHRAVVVGYGPSGRTIARLLAENGVRPTVIERNPETARALGEAGISVVEGDAVERRVLSEAGVPGAVSLILTAEGMERPEEVIRLARELNPALRVLVRASHLRDIEGLKVAGADEVFTGEGEVALALVEEVMRQLGATAEQIDRERDRVHDDLFAPRAAG